MGVLMSMFDRIWVNCPQCGEKVEFQSKAGPRELFDYNLDNAPSAILGEIVGTWEQCKCGKKMKLEGKVIIFPISI